MIKKQQWGCNLLKDIYKIINEANLVDTYDKTEHIKSINKLVQKRKSDIQNNKCPECGEKLNEADGMIFQTESQLKELGDKLSDDNKVAIEYALTELRMAHQSQDIPAIQTALDNINAAWKKATEAMYAQGEQGQAEAQPQGDAQSGDNVEDVEFEEVK